MPECPTDNSAAIDQSSFWGPDGVNWDAHRIGWAIAGGCALLASLGFLYSLYDVAILAFGMAMNGVIEWPSMKLSWLQQGNLDDHSPYDLCECKG